MAYHIDPRTIPQTASRLGTGTKLKGRLHFRDSVTISGRYEGEIDAEGFLYVRDGAFVQAEVRARRIIVGGTIHGNVEAIEEIEMLPGCEVHGNVRAGRIRIAEGVLFEGRCEMIRNADALDIFAGPLDELRRQAIPAIEPFDASTDS